MKLVIFTLDNKQYGVDISSVREVIRLRAVTSIPDSEDFIEGVISVRGKVLVLVNLRTKLGIKKTELLKMNRIIIVQIASHNVGLLVDGVSDVISINSGSITPVDEMLKDAKYLVGVVKMGERIVVIMDVEKLLLEEINANMKKLSEQIQIKKR